ncbi:hypothetical protein BHE90_001726 [Fusarium euwallaceae]|uniref:Uncharacterized protein n=1 Tax=Fusarium euwallaceae TaxID=1147111 RepID=A0A430M6Y4_9HYPO|nr:hypothetical protein BHE90_001726 [Fusarium euwallaceae]
MCTCEYRRFACGHERKRRYINCSTGEDMIDSSESTCGSINFTVVYTRGSCREVGCKYLECMVKGWACCRCDKGPNEGHVCRQDTTPWRWDYTECKHRFCHGCRPWREFEREKEMAKKKDAEGKSQGREVIRKGLHAISGGLIKGGGSARHW